MFRFLLSNVVILLIASPIFAQVDWQTANEIFKQQAHKFQLSNEDIDDLRLLSSHRSEASGLTHFYIQQQHSGIPISEAIINLHFTDEGKLHHSGSRAVVGVKDRVVVQKSQLNAATALSKVFDLLEYENIGDVTPVINEKEDSELHQFLAPTVATEPIDLRLIYELDEQGQLILAWAVDVNEKASTDWWQVRIDAATGKLLAKHNHTLHCKWDHAGFGSTTHAHQEVVETALPTAEFTPFQSGTYRVFPLGVESPSHGDAQLVSNPANNLASPFGWHDTNGVSGADFTITRGNNVYAQEDANGNDDTGNSPNGGNALNFNYPFNLNQQPATYQSGSVTNLFYWNNIMHDVFYQYGFNEAAGNFQVNNYNRGGNNTADDDAVRADGQDGAGTDNATFGTGGDGSSAVMTMFLFSPNSEFEVNQPSNFAGLYNHSLANWQNTPAGAFTVTGDVTNVQDQNGSTEACAQITMSLNGNIALIDRGNCEFGTKALNAENAGAIGVIICNNVAGAVGSMGPGADGDNVTIPVMMIQQDDCANLRSQPNLNVSLKNTGVFRDGSLDNGIIAHEYGHGISIRLTGGANTGTCLNNEEQMGEGWSDWFGLMLTMKPTDTRFDDRGVGTFATSQGNDGGGIRTFKYSTDLSVNPHTYNSISDFGGGVFGGASVHGVGSVWAEMLWEMSWNLIDKHGFDNDFYNGNGGNNIALALVTEGLKLQPCSPGFVDGRDAILMADQALNGGANECEIWCAFAKRGLGVNAEQNNSNNVSDGTESFDIPNNLTGCNCNSLAALPLELTDFSGTALTDDNLLQWTTSTEIDIQEYWIERSLDGQSDWKNIGQQAAQNKRATAARYELLDTKPVPAAYYRLASIDTDGTISYAETIFLKRKSQPVSEWNLYPNPTNADVQLQISATQSQPAVIRLQNALNQLVMQREVNVVAGQNDLSLSLTDLSSGIYWLSVEIDGQMTTRRLIKNN